MKTLTARSATLAACAALLITGSAVQASANDTDGHSGAHRSDTDHHKTNITVHGNNNNTAGNDLIIGNNNVSGTGNTVGTVPGSGDSYSFTARVHNCTLSNTLTYSNLTTVFPNFNGPGAISPPPSIAPHGGNVCDTSTAPDATWSVTGGVISAAADVRYTFDVGGLIDFSVTNTAFGVAASCPSSPAPPFSFSCTWSISGNTVDFVLNDA
ncbi:hypothetical protein AB0D37_44365 [Streptomyces sp. NPDC048384]|uniref:hypothetical protein n=1 Tax=Streptomyces sp. NPDC048384 TaxID=3155487 RepID=UPI00344294A2